MITVSGENRKLTEHLSVANFKRKIFPLLIMTIITSYALGSPLTINVEAHSGPTFTSSWSQPPTVDGFISPAEWARATVYSIVFSLTGTAAKLLVLNNGANLYLGFIINDDELGAGTLDNLEFRIDNLHNGGTLDTGDDYFRFTQYASGTVAVADLFFNGASYMSDSSAGGTTDVVAAASNVGPVGGGVNQFEFKHPLASGDTGHDFGVAPGSTLGFMIRYEDTDGSASPVGGVWPASATFSNQDTWADLVIGTRPTAGSGTWSPFGPREEKLDLKVYAEQSAMSTGFCAGQTDIADLPTSCANTDIFTTPPVPSDTLGSLQYKAVNCWNFQEFGDGTSSSLVSVQNHGFQTGWGFWSLLNMRQVPGCEAANPTFTPGCVDPPACTTRDIELIRRGLSQPLSHLSPFWANKPAELETISLVYDSMLKVNPMTEAPTTATFRVSAGILPTVAPGMPGISTVSCPAGYFATGGGSGPSTGAGLAVTKSTPILDGSGLPVGWSVDAFNPTGSGLSLQASVACMKPVTFVGPPCCPAATSTYEVTGPVVGVAPGMYGMSAVSCTAGDFATGGGFITSGDLPLGVSATVSDSFPTLTGILPTGWKTIGYNIGGTMAIQAVVVCMSPISGGTGLATYQVVGSTVSVSGSSFGTATAQCNAGDFATGGGSITEISAGGPLVIDNSYPNIAPPTPFVTPPNQWVAKSFNRASASQTLQSVVVCMIPRTGVSTTAQVLEWMTATHTASYNPVTDVTTQVWNLRNGLAFQNGSPLTASDICFTILSYRDVPSYHFGALVNKVTGCTILNSQKAEVTLAGQSGQYELAIGFLPIIPRSLWSTPCGDPPSPASVCADPGYDPVASGILNGSGPWVCKNPSSGDVGSGCAEDSTGLPVGQAVPAGGKVSLVRYDRYMRCCPNVQGSSLQSISWADKNNDGKVDILDIADAALFFGTPNLYWDHPLFGVTTGVVDIGEIATVAFYFDSGITKPYLPSALTGIDSQIDPFQVVLANPIGSTVYYKGARQIGGNLILELVIAVGPAAASDFVAQLSTDPGHVWGTTTFGAEGPPGRISISFGPVCPPPATHYDLRIRYPGDSRAITASSDWEHIELFSAMC